MTALKRIDLLKKKFNESLFRKKVAPKLMSLLFAVIFWLYVMDQVNPEMVRSFPNVQVEILNIDMVEKAGYTVLENGEHLVTVKVKGRRKSVMAMNTDDLALSIDLKSFKKGLNQFPIDRQLFTDSVVIESMSENRVSLTVEQLVSAPKPVHIKTVGVLPEGMSLDTMKLAPEMVMVSGPESFVSKVDRVSGELDVSQLKDSVSTEVMVIPVNSALEEVRGVTVSHNSVLCNFGLVKTQSVGVVPQLIEALPNNLVLSSVKVVPESILIKGSTTALDAVSSLKTEKIDLSLLKQSTELEVGLDLPADFKEVLSTTKVKVVLTLDEVDLKELDYVPAEVVLKNVPKGLNVSMADLSAMIKVKIRGSKTMLSDLDKGDLRLVIDCSKAKEGSQQFRIDYEHQLVQGTGIMIEPEWVEVVVVKVAQ